MITRIISGIVGVIALVAVLIFLPDYATKIAVGVVASIALFEFYGAVLGKGAVLLKKAPLVVAGYAFGLALAFVDKEYMLPVIVFGAIVILSIPVLCYKKITFKDCTAAFIGCVYIFALLRHVSMVRSLENGKFIVFAIFIGAFITDTGAYFAGCFLGKHKLAPKLSPKKTVEGSIGGIVATLLVFCGYAYIGNYFWDYGVNIGNLVITAISLSVISQIGDLAASAIKREMDIKDYGNIMPGHGGALDRFDSVLFVAPVFYYLNELLPIFVIK